MPTRKHRQKRRSPPPTALDRLNAWRAASHAYHFGTGTWEDYEAAKAAWEEAKAERQRERQRMPAETRRHEIGG